MKHTFYFKTGATFQIEGYLQILSKELWGTSHKNSSVTRKKQGEMSQGRRKLGLEEKRLYLTCSKLIVLSLIISTDSS